LLDRIIKLLVLSLGALLVFLVGHLLSFEREEARVPASAPASGQMAAPASRADAEAGKLDQTGGDLPTRRVKTFPVRPDDPSSVLQNR
jgi:hypothetical protein